MYKRLIAIILILMLPVCAFAAEAGTQMYVSAPSSDRVHLRQQPSEDGRSLGLYFTGTPVHAMGPTNDGWMKVLIGAAEGYIYYECLSSTQPASQAPAKAVANRHSTWVNLRRSPSTGSQSLGKFNNGTQVQLLGETSEGWSYVQVNGQKGYMITEMLGEGSAAAQAPVLSATHVPFTPITTVQPSRGPYTAGPTSRPAAGTTTVVGKTGSGNYIHAWSAPNGQTLYFDAMEQEPRMVQQDVNFDGRNDLVFYTSMGASNAWCEFFVFDGVRYHYVEHPGSEYGLPNYELHPQQGLVSTHANNGSAGALHENCLFRWEGNQLKLIRRAVGEEYKETDYQADRYVETTWNDRIRFRVYHQSEETGEGTVVFEEVSGLTDSITGVFERENAALWQGLR